MKRFYYIVNGGILHSLGVRNKVSAQATNLNNNIDVTIVIVGGHESQTTDLERMTSATIVNLERHRKLEALQVVEDIINVLKLTMSLNEGDIIYTRYSSLMFFAVPRKCTIITEHQAKESEEYEVINVYGRSQLSLIRMIEKYLGKLNRKLRDGFVAVTAEILEYEARYYGKKPGIIISNGIDASTAPLIRRKEPITTDFHILGLASVSPWHGYDRVIRGINEYSGNVSVFFHIVGDGGEIENLDKLARKFGISNKIIFHGTRDGEELDSIIEQCHLGIGVLGPHRKKLVEAASLKLREYCARGLPIVDSTVDVDFTDFPYIHRLESNEEPVDIDELIDFFNSCAAEDYPRNMRVFAHDKLDWRNKALLLESFLQSSMKSAN
jgi:glycosyltransferase involved in cell wall biosynthesis